MNNISVIYEYDKIMDKLAEDIKSSNYKLQYFINILGLKRGFFYKKLKEKRFTSEEVKKISKYLYPDQYEEYEENTILNFLEKSKEQIVKGETVDFENVITRAKHKYEIQNPNI